MLEKAFPIAFLHEGAIKSLRIIFFSSHTPQH